MWWTYYAWVNIGNSWKKVLPQPPYHRPLSYEYIIKNAGSMFYDSFHASPPPLWHIQMFFTQLSSSHSDRITIYMETPGDSIASCMLNVLLSSATQQRCWDVPYITNRHNSLQHPFKWIKSWHLKNTDNEYWCWQNIILCKLARRLQNLTIMEFSSNLYKRFIHGHTFII